MNHLAKLHLWSALYCGVLISLNWSRATQYARPVGLTSESKAPVMLALLLSLLVMVVLLWRVLRFVRRRLEAGEKVEPGRWIESWSVMIYALPLLWHQGSTSSWIAPDGTVATTVSGFGTDISPRIFLFAVVGLLLSQLAHRLSPR